MTKTISEKKKCKKEKRLSEEVLQTVEKRKEMKIMGKTERYTQLNAVLQRIAEREREKAFLNEQYRKVEKNKRMGKTRGLFKKMKRSRKYFMQG